MSLLPLILFVGSLLLDLDQLLAFSVGSRSILREVSSNGAGAVDYAVELNGTNFDGVLRDTPASFSVVEFFAHWLVIFASSHSLMLLVAEF